MTSASAPKPGGAAGQDAPIQPGEPAMVVHDERVVAVTAAAAQLGVRTGMRRNGALALAPDVRPLEQDIAGEAMALRTAAHALLQYSPQVTLLDPHVILVEVGAGLRLFGGVLAICRRIRQTLIRLGLICRLGMAPTAHAAWVLARARTRWRRRVRARALARVLDNLPWALLPEAWPHARWLGDIGCRTLGGLTRLPREGLQRRTSPALLRRLDQVYGQAPAVFTWIEAPAVFDQILELPERIEQAQAAEVAATRLLGWLCDWLAARQLAVRTLEWWLDHERGRHARPPTRLDICLAEPASHPDHLARLLHERLATLTLEAPVIQVRLTARDLLPQPTPSGTLFAEPGGTAADQRRLVELLTARLGRERVLRPSPVADHRPEAANHWQPADAPPAPAAGLAAQPQADRPFWLLPRPQPLPELHGHPAHANLVLRLVRGPERIEAGWWDGALCARDYFVAEDKHYARFWIYHERDTTSARWYLHGVFA